MLLFGYHKEFILKERGFFKISENKNPSKLTHYTIAVNTFWLSESSDQTEIYTSNAISAWKI